MCWREDGNVCGRERIALCGREDGNVCGREDSIVWEGGW